MHLEKHILNNNIVGDLLHNCGGDYISGGINQRKVWTTAAGKSIAYFSR